MRFFECFAPSAGFRLLRSIAVPFPSLRTCYSATVTRCRTLRIMPRVSGVSGSVTEWRILRRPIPSTVFACVSLKPMVLLTSVTCNIFAAVCFFALFLTMTLSGGPAEAGHYILPVRLKPDSGAHQLALFLAAVPGDKRGILQIHQAGKRGAHDVVRVRRAQ